MKPFEYMNEHGSVILGLQDQVAPGAISYGSLGGEVVPLYVRRECTQDEYEAQPGLNLDGFWWRFFYEVSAD